MGFSISISGHGPKVETVERVFEQAVRELRADLGEPVEGRADPFLSGSFSASDVQGGSASGTAEDVADE